MALSMTFQIGTTWELRRATSVPRPIQYREMELRNKTTSEFRTVFHSLLDVHVPTSQFPLYSRLILLKTQPQDMVRILRIRDNDDFCLIHNTYYIPVVSTTRYCWIKLWHMLLFPGVLAINAIIGTEMLLFYTRSWAEVPLKTMHNWQKTI